MRPLRVVEVRRQEEEPVMVLLMDGDVLEFFLFPWTLLFSFVVRLKQSKSGALRFLRYTRAHAHESGGFQEVVEGDLPHTHALTSTWLSTGR